MTRNCGHCHECGTPLRRCLDGEQWCETCRAYRRYRSHGWAWSAVYSHTSEIERDCPKEYHDPQL